MENEELNADENLMLRQHLPTMMAVAFIDLLGTRAATSASAIGSMAAIRQGHAIETIWRFLGDMCRIDDQLYVCGGSDSLLLFRQDFRRLLPLVCALFQISCLTRGFRIRGGIEIGNVYGLNDLVERELRTVPNLSVPHYLYGDGVTGAVLAEGKLRGSRLVLGRMLASQLQHVPFEEISHLIVARELGAFEVRWTDAGFTRDVFNRLNSIGQYAGPDETLHYGFRRFRDSQDDDYSKVMLGLGVEWGILTVDEGLGAEK